MEANPIGSITGTYEEVYQGHEIFIEPNRDAYREGFEWAVCRDAIEIAAGLSFTIADALDEARAAADAASTL
jgi:hypothetical protein